MTYKNRKYFTPSSLPASQTKELAARARKRTLTAKPLTYQELLEKQEYLVTTSQINPQTAANRTSALRSFLRINHINFDSPVGDELRSLFPESLENYLTTERTTGKSQKQITNLKSAITFWRQAVLEFDTANALANSKNTPFQSQLIEMIGEFTIKRVSIQAHVPYDMLLGWTAGKRPRASSIKYLARLEKFFGMQHGGLTELTGLSHAARFHPPAENSRRIEYRETLAARTGDHYWLKPPPESALRAQWAAFMTYKTAPVPTLMRSSKGRWRISPLPLERNTPANWFRFHQSQEVPSAGPAWAKVAGFLGWCALPIERGGAGISVESLQTMAWLVDPELLQRYVQWRRARDTKLTTAVPEMLGWFQSLLRANEGYFPQSPWLQKTLPVKYQDVEWATLCAHQFEVCRQLLESMRGEVEVSRDPFDPITDIVELDEPFEALADMVQRMRAERPVGNPQAEAIWARDLLIIKLLASNPLRLRQFAHLTWRPDNTGNLYQKSDGSWHIRWRSRFFKNARFAAGDMNYDSPVQETVWPDIEAYLFKYRSRMLHEPTDLVFLVSRRNTKSRARPHVPWLELSRRVETLTRRYLWRCPGVGAHSMRHIVGTAIVKAAPGDFTTVARVLNDRPLTVQKHYTRFTSGDGAKRMGELLQKSFKRM